MYERPEIKPGYQHAMDAIREVIEKGRSINYGPEDKALDPATVIQLALLAAKLTLACIILSGTEEIPTEALPGVIRELEILRQPPHPVLGYVYDLHDYDPIVRAQAELKQRLSTSDTLQKPRK